MIRRFAKIKLIISGTISFGPNKKINDNKKEYRIEDDDEENSYRVTPHTPLCEKFFAIAM